MNENKKYLISTLRGDPKKVTLEGLKKELQRIHDDEWVVILENEKCIYDGYAEGFKLQP